LGGDVARIVKIRRSGPYRIETSDGPIYVCGCGLSREMPFCDQTHKFCWREDPDKLYSYDERMNATEIGDDIGDS
jgi:CDGSH-type Zn-finger protein